MADNHPSENEHDSVQNARGAGLTFTPATAGAIIGAIVAIVVVVALLFQGGDDRTASPIGLSPPTTGAGQSTITPAPNDGDRPQIPPIDCVPLWSGDDMVGALSSEDDPARNLSSSILSGGEICVEELLADAAYFLRVEPGAPSDFVTGAALNEQQGRPVADVGDDARWFGDSADAPALLAVYVETPVGEVFFRVSVGRPDLSPAERLEVVANLGRTIVSNFPYVEVDPPPPVEVRVEHESTLSEPRSLDELLAAGVQAGEWTDGEGLVEALRFLLGEPTDFERPFELDLFNASGTPVVLEALDFVNQNPSDADTSDIKELLDQLSFPKLVVTPVDEPPGEEPEAEDATGGEEVALAVSPGAASFISLSFAPTQLGDPDIDCGLGVSWFDVDCMVVEDIDGVRFGFPRGALTGSVAGWNLNDVEQTRAAIRTVVAEYSQYGTMDKVELLFTLDLENYSNGVPARSGDHCQVRLNTPAQDLDTGRLQFLVAMDLAGCFLYENARDAFSSYAAGKWWYQGMVVFLAAEAFPLVDSEWDAPIERLEASELETSLQDRTVGNWPLFRSIATNTGGVPATLDLIRSITDAPTVQAQKEVLAANSSSAPSLHRLHQELSDSDIPDTGNGGFYAPSASVEIEITEHTIILDEPIRFGVTRMLIVVPDGMTACVTYDGAVGVTSSWRQGQPSDPAGAWTFELPAEISDASLFVFTTVEPGTSLSLTIDPSDESGCEEADEDGSDIEIPDCGLCSPSAYFRSTGAHESALSE